MTDENLLEDSRHKLVFNRLEEGDWKEEIAYLLWKKKSTETSQRNIFEITNYLLKLNAM